MEEKEKKEKAEAVYQRLMEALRDNHWYFTDVPEGRIVLSYWGDHGRLNLEIQVRAEDQTVRFFWKKPVGLGEDQLSRAAEAVNYTNDRITFGCFGVNLQKKELSYRAEQCFHGSIIGKEALFFMVVIACTTPDDYGDRIWSYTAEKISREQFKGLFK